MTDKQLIGYARDYTKPITVRSVVCYNNYSTRDGPRKVAYRHHTVAVGGKIVNTFLKKGAALKAARALRDA